MLKRLRIVGAAIVVLATAFLTTRAQVGDALLSEESIGAAVADHMAAASSAFARADYETSLAHYTEVATCYPDHPRAKRAAVNMGYVLRELGRLEEARDAFDRVVASYPETAHAAEAQTRLGYVALALGDRDEAREHFARAVVTYPGTRHAGEAQLRLGYLCLAERPLTDELAEKEFLRHEAAEAFLAVIEGYSDYPDIASEAYAQYAGLYFEWGMDGHFAPDEVRAVCRDVLESFPDGAAESLATAQLMIAESYAGQGRHLEAYEAARLVSDRYPDAKTPVAFSLWLAGAALQKLGRFEEGLLCYDRVLTDEFTDKDNFKGMDVKMISAVSSANCLVDKGDAVAALAAYEGFVERWPDSSCTPHARAQIGRLTDAAR